MDPRRTGFSLIEVVAVLLIVGLMAGLGIVALRSQRQSATIESVTRAVLGYEASARQLAERSGEPVDLAIGRDGMIQQPLNDSSRNEPMREPLLLPDGYSIRDVWFARGDSNPDQVVRIGREGRSRSYGFRLEGPNAANRWIVVSGATGELQVSPDDEQTRQTRSILAQTRLDAP